jgi:hypothetical protein
MKTKKQKRWKKQEPKLTDFKILLGNGLSLSWNIGSNMG